MTPCCACMCIFVLTSPAVDKQQSTVCVVDCCLSTTQQRPIVSLLRCTQAHASCPADVLIDLAQLRCPAHRLLWLQGLSNSSGTLGRGRQYMRSSSQGERRPQGVQMADRLTVTWAGHSAAPSEGGRKEAEKLSKTFASLPSTWRSAAAPGLWDPARSQLTVNKVAWHEIYPSASHGSASSVASASCSASLGRTTWTPDACSSPHAVGSALAAGPALPVWTTWNEMRFSQAAIELQRPVQKRTDDTPSSVGNADYEYVVPKNLRLLDTLSEEAGEDSSSGSTHAAFITIDDCVSYERPWSTPTDSSPNNCEKADRHCQSWPRASGPPRMRLADLKKVSKKARDRLEFDRLELGGASGGKEPQPPTPRMILKQLRDSGKSWGSNRSSSRSRGSRHTDSRANSKSSSMKQRIARSSSKERVRAHSTQHTARQHC